jgi:hypothetical protein
MDMGSMPQPEMMMPSGMEGGMEGGMMMDMGGGGDDMNFPKNEEETLMVRSLDFTVDPDTTYRFRVRLIVFNPNYNREDVTPGVDTKALELFSDWSKPTDEVTVPPDVATYAMEKVRNADQVKFQVTRWDPNNGVMVVRSFDAGPGNVIGDYQVAEIPTSEGTGAKRERVDFNSHQIVLDATGGDQAIPRTLDVGRFETPATSMMVRADGTVVIRSQAFDQLDEVRKSTEESYKREVEESNKKRESSSGYMDPSMMAPG